MTLITSDVCYQTNDSLLSAPLLLRDPIKNIIARENYIKYDIKIAEYHTHGDNFMGKLYEVDINGETAEFKKQEHIFIKEIIHVKDFNVLSLEELFSREAWFYKEISEILKSLQDQANIPTEDRYKFPKVFAETDNKTIVLENLSQRGFKTYQKKKIVPIKYTELGVQELAKFHALNFVFESKMPEFYSEKVKVLRSAFSLDNEDWRGLMRNIFAHVANLFEGEKKQKIENFLPKTVEKFPKYLNDQTTVKCTLTHGDFKRNNVLFREKDGEPVEVMVIDYQFINYGCPIKDFLLFIFAGSDREFRRKHLDDLKESYFETLSRFLKYFDMDVEVVYPRKEFEKVYTEWLDFGLMNTLFYSIVIMAPSTGVEFDKYRLAELPFCPEEYYDSLLRDLVDDFIEWGYL